VTAPPPVVSIVDDDTSVRVATARLLRALGFSVYAFPSADEFLSSPRLTDTSCLILDVQMPGMSGIELQQHLIAHGHEVPTVFITAIPEDYVREQAINAGAVCFLSKPFDDSQLMACVEQALTRHHKPAERSAIE
jgi:FixJ family two-component response regulator